MSIDVERQKATVAVLVAVEDERTAQEAQWGKQRHDFAVWSLVLSEEVGEASAAILAARAVKAAHRDDFGPEEGRAELRAAWANVRKELVQVAAVAVAAIEHLDEIGAP